MTENASRPITAGMPSLRALGLDLVRISRRQCWTVISLPFLCCAAYFAFATLGCWPAAVLAVAALSFMTYGSTSHDLVHQSLGLSRQTNDWLLCVIELLALRSGHAYKAAHLHHHARFPADDDIEATAARKTCLEALAEGPAFQLRIWWWAYRRGSDRRWVIAEGSFCLLGVTASLALTVYTPVFLVYTSLMVVGSWVIPLITSYVPHNPAGESELSQTRAFRGIVASVIAMRHLYHLEHHLYPAVPHPNWPELARRLDPYLKCAGVLPVRLWF